MSRLTTFFMLISLVLPAQVFAASVFQDSGKAHCQVLAKDAKQDNKTGKPAEGEEEAEPECD